MEFFVPVIVPVLVLALAGMAPESKSIRVSVVTGGAFALVFGFACLVVAAIERGTVRAVGGALALLNGVAFVVSRRVAAAGARSLREVDPAPDDFESPATRTAQTHAGADTPAPRAPAVTHADDSAGTKQHPPVMTLFLLALAVIIALGLLQRRG